MTLRAESDLEQLEASIAEFSARFKPVEVWLRQTGKSEHEIKLATIKGWQTWQKLKTNEQKTS